MCGTPYPTIFLGDCLRGRQLIPVEQAVRLITDVPARLFGLRERGQVREGWHADLVLIDPETVDAGPIRTVHDLPGGTARLTADSIGVRRVLVGGQTTVVDGAPQDPEAGLPGRILRSGVDTETVEVPGPRS
jgi:N-acyl-D-aspartate/D-glutamate deacylase